jgi:hypothetical protein
MWNLLCPLERKDEHNTTIRFTRSIHGSIFVTINFPFIALCYFFHCPNPLLICLVLVVLRVSPTEAVITSNDRPSKIIRKAFVAYYIRRHSNRHTYKDMKDFFTFVKLPPSCRIPLPTPSTNFFRILKLVASSMMWRLDSGSSPCLNSSFAGCLTDWIRYSVQLFEKPGRRQFNIQSY